MINIKLQDPTQHYPHLCLQGTGWSPQDGQRREYNLQGLPLTLQEERTPEETHEEWSLHHSILYKDG